MYNNNILEYYSTVESNKKDDEVKDIDVRELRNLNICSSFLYNGFVYVVLIGIILFFVWYMIKRPFIDESQLTPKTTPFS